MVQVVPDLSGSGEIIPVSIQLVETSFREMKVGGGVGTQNGEQVLRVSTELEHVNFLHRLLTLKLGATGGWKSFGTAEDFVESIDLTEEEAEIAAAELEQEDLMQLAAQF